MLVDEHSRNGTLVNGKLVRTAALCPGDLIGVGGTFMTFLDDNKDRLIGESIGGYLLESRLGRGGMGTVYKARQVALKRRVALKVLSPELSEDEDFVKQFVAEARSAAKLNHGNVVRVFDAGSDKDVYFLSMEYLQGGSLQSLLDRDGAFPMSKALSLILDASRALIWAERHAIVHRDVKPDNLLIDRAGSVKIADFGLASDRSLSKTTFQKGAVLGTPHHMAPEQAQGKPADFRADMYALGSTLYVMLTGKTPFEGDTPLEILFKKVKGDPPPLDKYLPDAPENLQWVVSKLMAREREDRFGAAQEAYDELVGLKQSILSA